jgi:hypothetical protein
MYKHLHALRWLSSSTCMVLQSSSGIAAYAETFFSVIEVDDKDVDALERHDLAVHDLRQAPA